jgi:hypothetical protein
MANSDVELEIYKQNCEDLRFYGDMRFKQLTLWSVGMGFVLNVVYGKEAVSLTAYQRGIWYEVAFFWTVVIWVMEVRSSVHGVRRMRFKGRIEGESNTDLSNKVDAAQCHQCCRPLIRSIMFCLGRPTCRGLGSLRADCLGRCHRLDAASCVYV